MIFTESTIKISNNVSKMDSTIVLYRGDKNVEIRFTILQSPFKYSNTVATNVIESTNASYGQLVIKTPNDKPPIFSEVSATKEGTVLFTITKEMIDEIEEVGVYTFQIRLMDENKQSRVTIPPVENGIEIKEPIAIEDDNTTNVVGLAKANYAVATLSDADTPTFDDNGKYNKTNWNDGDIITNVSLNKIEDGIYTTNENVTATKKYVDNGINYNNKQINNRIVAMNISKHPVSCSTEIYKKPLCDIFPELLNITYNTVFRDSNSFKVNMDNFAKEYPTVKSAYNKLNINLYDENDNSIGNSYGNSINGDGLNVIFINITESLRFYAYFDKALVDGSSTTMETKNGYMTIQLLIPKGNNKQEFIDKIKNLKLTLSVIRTDFLNLNNETIYTPTTDYNPATKKYVDDKVTVKILPVDYNKNCATNVADLEPHSIYMSPNDAKFLYLGYEKLDGSFSGLFLSGNPHGKFIYTGAKDDTKIEIMMEGSCYTVYFKTDTVDAHVEKTVFYLTKNNTTEFTPSNDYEPATKKYVDDIKTDIVGNNVEPQDSDIPRVFFNGEKPTSKTAVHARIEYKSKTKHFKGYVEIKCQGTSSMAYPKKNYTIKPYEDETKTKKLKIDFKGWGAQSKFCLKANFIDHSHARNICAARLWNQIVASRANYSLLPELLRTSPCNGAIDGFPIKVYYNDTYEGVYTWNIPKDKWMFNMDDTLDNHCVLCGEEYDSGCFLTANASLWSDEIHDVMPTSIVTSFNAFQNFVINSTDDEFKANLENYVYVDSLIDYYIFQYAICGLDSMGKNQLFATYDGTKWIATSYDMDSTFGLYWNGQSYVSATYRMQEDYESGAHGKPNKLYVRLEKLFVNEIKARYKQLRADILSYNNIVNTFEPFMDIIGNDLYAEDLTIYTEIPNGSTNNIQQIRNYYRDRLVYVDAQINALQEAIPCTNITLNNATLSFTTTDTQTLTATVTPTNTTDAIVWSVNPTGICTVENGTVTPTSNGQCTITATCGTKSATCNVTVNLPVVAVTALNLDKDSITLGDATETDTSNTNLLDGVNHTIDSNTNNITFDYFTLDAGTYVFKNINEGTFTWLGAKYNGSNYETGNISDEIMFKFDESVSAQFHAFPDNKSTNTADKLGLYKLGKLINPIKFTVAGNGYYKNNQLVTDTDNNYSTTVTLDSSKKYVLMNDGNVTIDSYLCTWLVNNDYSNNGFFISSHSPIKLFENVSSLSVSINTVNNALSDLTLYEVSSSASPKYKDRLIAALTPANATNKNVTWTADNENVVLVPNGLNCTVKAKAVGNSVVTCTSQDATNGTIADTCTITINNVPNIPSIDYELSEPLVCDGTSTYKDTGIQLLSSNNVDRDWTMLVEFTPAQISTQWFNVVAHCMKEESPYPGINIDISSSNIRVIIPNNKQMYTGTPPAINTPIRYALVKQGKIFTLYNQTGVVLASQETGADITPVEQTLILGAYQTVDGVKGRFFNGTINKFKLVEEIYTVPQIRQYFGIVDDSIAYTLPQETTFNGTSDYVDTGIQLFKNDRDFTITMDVTADDLASGQHCIVHCMKEVSPYPGITIQKDVGYNYALGKGSNTSMVGSVIPINKRTKVVIVKNGTTMKVYNSNGVTGESVYNFTSIDQTLLLGSYQNTLGTKGRYFKGTIHAFSISNTVYTDEQINTYLGVNVATD